MSASDALKLGFDLLHFSGATRLARPLLRGRGAIFCLHQVFPGGGADVGYAPNHQLELDTGFLDAVLTHLKNRGYALVSMDDAAQMIATGSYDREPFAVFTLDDGYTDNLVHAAPVFRKHACPYTIYVAPDIAEGRCELWWRILEQLIAKGMRFTETIGGVAFDLPTRTEAERNVAAGVIFPAVKSLPEYEQRRWIREVATRHKIDVDGYCRSVAMTWSDMRGLIKDPLCTIGAHTVNHYAVARLVEHDALTEMTASKQRIEEELGRAVEHFAYPYGDEPAAGTRDFALARKAGFKSSVTTRKGLIYPEHRSHMQALPRVMMSGRYQKIRYIDALISGLPLALLNKFSRVNVS